MPLTLEEEAKLLPLAEKAAALITDLIIDDDEGLEEIFKNIIRSISEISPFVAKLYTNMYESIPDLRGRALDYVKNNI